MREPIPTIMLYKGSQHQSEPCMIGLTEDRDGLCLFSDRAAAANYRDTHPDFGEGWEIGGPMDQAELLEELQKFDDPSDLVALDPKVSDEQCRCIPVPQLREILARGEDKAEFDLYPVARGVNG